MPANRNYVWNGTTLNAKKSPQMDNMLIPYMSKCGMPMIKFEGTLVKF